MIGVFKGFQIRRNYLDLDLGILMILNMSCKFDVLLLNTRSSKHMIPLTYPQAESVPKI